jgi:hypothetical protein
MIYIQFLTSIESLSDKLKLYQERKRVIINIITKDIKTKTLIDYAEEKQIPKYKAVEYLFVYNIIIDLLEINDIIIIGLIGMDKYNIYNLIIKLNKLVLNDKQIILIYNSSMIIKEGIINASSIVNKKIFDELLCIYENYNISTIGKIKL